MRKHANITRRDLVLRLPIWHENGEYDMPCCLRYSDAQDRAMFVRSARLNAVTPRYMRAASYAHAARH